MICTARTNRSLAVEVFCNGLSKNNDEHLEAMNFNSFPSRRLYFSTTAEYQQFFARNRARIRKGAEKNIREVPHLTVSMLKKIQSFGLQVSVDHDASHQSTTQYLV